MIRTVVCFVFYAGLIQGFTEKCYTKNGKFADCVPSEDCPTLSKSVESNQESVKHAHNSTCGSTSNLMICCETKQNIYRQTVNRTARNKLIPNRRLCGFQHSDDYFHSANGTVVTEFPWLAQIKVQRSEYWEDYECTGSLINKRYVLTSAWCLNNSEFTAVGVRLGEFDVWNKTDCTEEKRQLECSDDLEDFGIEKIIPHPHYDEMSGDNDIGLIRLNRTVRYSDFIRPVCLPYPEVKFVVGTTFITSGWGQLTHRKEAVQKARLESALITHEECRKALSVENITVKYSGDKFFCAQPMSEQICSGENHGSPVMSSRKRKGRQVQWFQRAMVTTKSYKTTCLYPLPTLYTNVTYYLRWIEDNVEPYDSKLRIT